MTELIVPGSRFSSDGWNPDWVLPGYECLTIDLCDQETVGEEPAGSLRSILVRRGAPRHSRAVIYLHGWNDYFFQTHVADYFDAQGFDFYAIELRRYGRSLVEGQYAGYVDSIDDYFVELDSALAAVAADHDSVTLMAHSTGGLIGSLWADARPGALSAVILNSPWLESQSSRWLRQLPRSVFSLLRTANRLYPLTVHDNGFFIRSIHASQEGEWDYDLTLKGHPAFRARIGWLRAIMEGHRRVAAGLDITAPVLLLTSKRSDFSKTWHEGLRRADIVLDVDQIASRTTSLGDHVSLVRVADGAHDLFLSSAEVRQKAFDEVTCWSKAYLKA